MTQLEKLELLDSQWKMFATCKNEIAKEYAKTLMMYLLSKGKISRVEKISAASYHIGLSIRKHDRDVNVYIYGESDCDIDFYLPGSDKLTHTLERVDYFGEVEIMIEMFFAEGMPHYENR